MALEFTITQATIWNNKNAQLSKHGPGIMYLSSHKKNAQKLGHYLFPLILLYYLLLNQSNILSIDQTIAKVGIVGFFWI